MRISIVGAGRLATHLARGLSPAHQMVQIYARDVHKAQALAQDVAAQAIDDLAQLDVSVDLIFICVSDQAIADVAQHISQQISAKITQQIAAHQSDQSSLQSPNLNPLLVHCSGSTDLQLIAQYHTRSGVLYPLQTFSVEKSITWSDVPLLLEVNQSSDIEILEQLATSLSKRQYVYTSAQRLSLHLAAVFACNFANYCYDMAQQISDAAQVDFSLLHPLMLETAFKATQFAPSNVQTGPAVRGDTKILDKHQQLLAQSNTPQALLAVYQHLSQMIMQQHQSKSSYKK